VNWREPGWPAKYPDVCPRCNRGIRVGDRIVRQGGNIIHVGCASGSDDV
jgi:hypothetical protein